MERTLFDAQGHPIAYIADDGERSIYLWSGHAVAYIDERLNCYGWNGQHLGWVEDGILFDQHGLRVGFMRVGQPEPLGEAPAKSDKAAKRAKLAKCTPSERPARSRRTSNLPLAEFLKAGAVDSW